MKEIELSEEEKELHKEFRDSCLDLHSLIEKSAKEMAKKREDLILASLNRNGFECDATNVLKRYNPIVAHQSGVSTIMVGEQKIYSWIDFPKFSFEHYGISREVKVEALFDLGILYINGKERTFDKIIITPHE